MFVFSYIRLYVQHWPMFSGHRSRALLIHNRDFIITVRIGPLMKAGPTLVTVGPDWVHIGGPPG